MIDWISKLAKNQVLGRLGMLDDEEDLGVTFMTPVVRCTPTFQVAMPLNEFAVGGISEAVLLKNGYGRPCVVLQGDCACEEGLESQLVCWVVAIGEEDVPAVEHLFERVVSEDSYGTEAFGSDLAAHLAGCPVMSLCWYEEGLSAMADAFDRLEILMVDQEEWQGLEGTLEVVKDEGEVLSLPLRESKALTPQCFRFGLTVFYEARLPFVYRAKTGWETDTLIVAMERRRANEHGSWDAWSLYLSALGVSTSEGCECVLGRACMAQSANSVEDLFAEIRPVPLWLVRKLFEEWNRGWCWAEEAGTWVNAERDEWLSWFDGMPDRPSEDGEPYAHEEDAFWERVDPSRWREG